MTKPLTARDELKTALIAKLKELNIDDIRVTAGIGSQETIVHNTYHRNVNIDELKPSLIELATPLLSTEPYDEVQDDNPPMYSHWVLNTATGDELVVDTTDSFYDRWGSSLEGFKAAALLARYADVLGSVYIDYAGSGDSGDIFEIHLYDKKGELLDSSQPQEIDVMEGIEALGYALLEEHHGGWEINEGSEGEIEMDLTTGKITIEHNQFYDELEGVSSEFALSELSDSLRDALLELEDEYNTFEYWLDDDNNVSVNSLKTIDDIETQKKVEALCGLLETELVDALKTSDLSVLVTEDGGSMGSLSINREEGVVDVAHRYTVRGKEHNYTECYIRLPQLRDQYVNIDKQREQQSFQSPSM